MSTTDQQRRALAYLTKSYRATIHGANQWDEPGIIAALTRVAHINLGMQTMAAMRAAADPTIRTPAMIGDPSSSVYVEKIGPERAPRHPAPATACHICGRSMHAPDIVCDTPTPRQGGSR